MIPAILSRFLMLGDLTFVKNLFPTGLQLEENPIFKVIVPLVTILGTTWALWNQGYPFVERFMVNARITEIDPLYDDLIRWTETQTSFISFDARGETPADSVPKPGRRQRPRMDSAGMYVFSTDPTAEPRTTPTVNRLNAGINLTPSKGSSFFWFKKTLIHLTLFSMGAGEGRAITIHCMTRSVAVLRCFLEEVRAFSKDQTTSFVSVWRIATGREVPRWARVTSRPARDISTLILPTHKKDTIIKDAREYMHPRTRRWYSNHGIPYRRGYLFSGPPGTGKSSLAFTIAGMLGLDIFVICLSDPEISEGQLMCLLSKVPSHSVVLLEDVDAAAVGMSRKLNTSKIAMTNTTRSDTPQFHGPSSSVAQPVSLAGLLNAIDGVESHEGHILIMTTNDPESLDRALIRPGRVDMHLKFALPGREEFKELFRSIYSGLEEFTDEKCPSHDIDALSSRFAAQMPENRFSVADVQGFLLQHKLHPEEACEKATKWVEDYTEDKEHDTLSEITGSGHPPYQPNSQQHNLDEQSQLRSPTGRRGRSNHDLMNGALDNIDIMFTPSLS